MSLGPENKRQLKLAVLDLPKDEATKVFKLGHLWVGYLSCVVRLRIVVLRCFKCLGYGHRRGECIGTKGRIGRLSATTGRVGPSTQGVRPNGSLLLVQ